MNLHLFLPPLSAHPTSCIKGLIVGNILQYWKQNNAKEFISCTADFIQQLINRGHSMKLITPHLHNAAAIIDKTRISHTPQQILSNNTTLYLHWTFHPNGLTQQDLCNIYNQTLRGFDNFEHMTITISCPKNLRDIMTHKRLNEPKGLQVSDHPLLLLPPLTQKL